MDMFDKVIAKAREMTGVPEQPTAVEPVHGMLADLAATVEKQNQLEAWLEQDPNYGQLIDARTHISMLEDKIKEYMKELNYDRVEQSGYEAILTIRHMKGVMHYDIQAIEQEPTLATTIVKTVNERLFKAVIEGKSLDASMYCTPEPGTETKAVTIRKVETKGGTHEG